MSRIVQKDYRELISFLESYSLRDQLLVIQFQNELKTQHRKLYSVMIYVSELEFQNNNDFQEHSLGYVKEMLSDMIHSLFCWCNGVYKPALLSHRSAIETFTKAVVGNADATIFLEKSMYAVFDTAKLNPWFCPPIGSSHYNTLHNNYVLLCQTVHSATASNLEHLSSVGILPKFDLSKSKSCYDLFISTMNSILGTLLLNSKITCLKMHPTNKQIFLDAIPKSIKQEILLNV